MAEAGNSRPPRVRKADQAGVYVIINAINGKRYVGSSCNMPQRWRQHRHTLKAGTSSCRRLQAAWRKYGPDAFSFKVQEIVIDDATRGEREQYWMDTLGTFKCGYNSSPTVQVSDYMPRPPEWGRLISEGKRGKKIKVGIKTPISDEHREAISAGLKRYHAENPGQKMARPHTPEHRRKIGAGVRARFASAPRQKFTDEHRARMSEAQRNAWASGKYQSRDSSESLRKGWVTRRSNQS